MLWENASKGQHLAYVTDKIFLDEERHLLDGYRLGTQIFERGFRPSFIVGVWRGGAVVGMVVQECLATLGIETDHIALRTSYEGRSQYESTLQEERAVRVHGKQYLLETMNADDRLLIVDDVFSSGRHTQAVISSLRAGMKRNFPREVRVASVWFRTQDPDSAVRKPDFYVHTTNAWVVLPFEIKDLSENEIALQKPALSRLLGAQAQRDS